MTILVDRPVWAHTSGHRFAHLVSDRSCAELDAFVTALRTSRALRFHRDHYDVPDTLWPAVVAAGGEVVSTRELVTRLRAAGLRRPRPARRQ